MEKDLIIKYLAHEIRFHDCLIIPDFGGFIGSYESAYFDQSQGKYFPPSKALIFNTNLTNNDGLLANRIKDGEGISYLSALSIIENTVEFWKKEIEEGHRIEIADFGYIYKTKLGHIQFYQNKAINLYPGSFGLSAVTATGAKVAEVFETVQPVSLKEESKPIEVVEPRIEKRKSVKPVQPVALKEKKEEPKVAPVISLSKDEEIVEETSKEHVEENVIPHPASRKFRIPRRYVIAASFIPFMFYSIWIPLKTDFAKTGKIQVSDFNPFSGSKKAKYEQRDSYLLDYKEEEFIPVEEYLKTLPEDTKTFSYPFDEDCYIPVKLDGNSDFLKKIREEKNAEVPEIKEEDKVEAPVKVEEPKKEVQPISNGNYHIIAGCFGEKANADNLVESIQAKGYEAQILDQHKGLYRVSASRFSSKNEAIQARSSMKSNGVNGWILKY